jgi:hypothetical protein
VVLAPIAIGMNRPDRKALDAHRTRQTATRGA